MTPSRRDRGDLDLNLRSGPQLREYRAIYERIARDRPGRLLDWGCGHGHAADALQRAGLEVVALEYRPDVEEGQRERLHYFPDVEAVLTPESVRLPFEDASFDAVLSLGVLEHVPDPAGSLAEIHRVLRPGGRFYVYKLPNRFSYLEKVARLAGLSYHGEREHDTLWTVRETREALARHGFEVVSVRRANMLPLTLPGSLAARLSRVIWVLNVVLSRIPVVQLAATNVEAVARRPDQQTLIEANVRGYRRVARRYEEIHDEIFNDVEQARVRTVLARALDARLTPAKPGRARALDFGCGSGNVTRHLLDLGANVLAADVSPRFLRMVRQRFPGAPLETMALNGRDLAQLPSEHVDLAVSYSVLHHIPDYAVAVRELCRVLRPGGVLLIDHESAPREWSADPELAAYRAAVLEHTRGRRKSLRRFFDPAHYRELLRHYRISVRRLRDPRYWPEGDIHVWPDDHIDWDLIEREVRAAGCEVLAVEDYLLYRRGAPRELYERFRTRTGDVRLMLARRSA